jgi:hypothetical protein
MTFTSSIRYCAQPVGLKPSARTTKLTSVGYPPALQIPSFLRRITKLCLS